MQETAHSRSATSPNLSEVRCASSLNSGNIVLDTIFLYRAPGGAGNSTEHVGNFTRLVRGQAPQPGAYHNVLRMRRWLVSLDSTYGVKGWEVSQTAVLFCAVPCCAWLHAIKELSLWCQGLGGEPGCRSVLCCAVLRRAVLALARDCCALLWCCAVQCCAVLCCAVLCSAVPCCAVLCHSVHGCTLSRD